MNFLTELELQEIINNWDSSEDEFEEILELENIPPGNFEYLPPAEIDDENFNIENMPVNILEEDLNKKIDFSQHNIRNAQGRERFKVKIFENIMEKNGSG